MMSQFIEAALIAKPEELEEVKRLRCEPSRPLSELIKELGLDGEV